MGAANDGAAKISKNPQYLAGCWHFFAYWCNWQSFMNILVL